MADKQCSINGCDSPVVAKKMCNKHYRQILRAKYPPCSIDGCKNKSREGTLCSAHAHRKRRHGDPLKGSSFNGEPAAFVKAAVELSKNGHVECIVWPFNKCRNGYGQLHYQGETHKAHRLSFALSGNEIRDGEYCCHEPKVCHNPSCINPRHLRSATPKENMLDKKIDGTDNIGVKNGQSKLNENRVREIKRGELTRQQYADKFGVSKSTIDQVVWGNTWKHVTI